MDLWMLLFLPVLVVPFGIGAAWLWWMEKRHDAGKTTWPKSIYN